MTTCTFYIVKKNRLCGQSTRGGAVLCGAHDPRSVACKYCNTQIREHVVDAYMRICPRGRLETNVAASPWYIEGCNKPKTIVQGRGELMCDKALMRAPRVDVEQIGGLDKVLLFSQAAEMQIIKANVEKLKSKESRRMRTLPARLTLNQYFSGRDTELEDVRERLEKFGCALITQYGGAGKTQLMVLMADVVEKNNLAPRVMFWISGNEGRYQRPE